MIKLPQDVAATTAPAQRTFPLDGERPSIYKLAHQPHPTEAGPTEVGPSYVTAVHPQERGRTKRSNNTIGSAWMNIAELEWCQGAHRTEGGTRQGHGTIVRMGGGTAEVGVLTEALA